MQKGKLCVVRAAGVVLAGLLMVTCKLSAQTRAHAAQIEVADLNRQIRDFLEREVTAHVADIKTLNPPPDRVVSALTTGEFSWGTFISPWPPTPNLPGHVRSRDTMSSR